MQPDIGMSPIPKVCLSYPRNGVPSLQCKLTELFMGFHGHLNLDLYLEECLSYLVKVWESPPFITIEHWETVLHEEMLLGYTAHQIWLSLLFLQQKNNDIKPEPGRLTITNMFLRIVWPLWNEPIPNTSVLCCMHVYIVIRFVQLLLSDKEMTCIWPGSIKCIQPGIWCCIYTKRDPTSEGCGWGRSSYCGRRGNVLPAGICPVWAFHWHFWLVQGSLRPHLTPSCFFFQCNFILWKSLQLSRFFVKVVRKWKWKSDVPTSKCANQWVTAAFAQSVVISVVGLLLSV